jgi:deazaflavin-dependent oxidoreductase (nitroreductase family)
MQDAGYGMSQSPAELGGLSREKFIYLSTVGRITGKAHTVELWFAWSNGKVYLSQEGEQTDWMKNIQKNPDVKFKIGGRPFSGKGRVFEKGPEFEDGKRALYEKYYGKAPKEKVDDWFSLSKVIALSQASKE